MRSVLWAALVVVLGVVGNFPGLYACMRDSSGPGRALAMVYVWWAMVVAIGGGPIRAREVVGGGVAWRGRGAARRTNSGALVNNLGAHLTQ